ncbi:MAG: hypothetical protein M1814_002357 [Vezdaea aestivalis]|nr:MAG: hypothetical protein M1814_002357 [Vezdaea aestivalis]
MPRASTTRRINATASSARNEAALALSTKRVQKQKPNGHLHGALRVNGSANGKIAPVAAETSSPISSPAHPDYHERSRSSSVSGEHDSSTALFATGVTRSSSSTSNASYDPSTSSPATDHSQCNEDRSFFTHESEAPTDSSVQNFDMFSISTVLTSCPVGDTIAIMILLLQIPQIFLIIVHGFFAAHTFATPSGPFSSILRIGDFSPSSTGDPALGTIIFCDLVGLLLWNFLWTPLQTFVLDFAQVVIAVALGGSRVNDDGPRTASFCLSFLVLTYLWPSNKSEQGSGGTLRAQSALTPKAIASIQAYSDILRTGLALHISTQGVVRWARKHIQQHKIASTETNPQYPNKSMGQKGANGNSLSSNSTSVKQAANMDRPYTPDLNARDSHTKSVSGKKQAMVARSNQPLWAAIATTRVFRSKDSFIYDHHSKAGKFWISRVGPNDFSFYADLYQMTQVNGGISDISTAGYISSGVDRALPFFLRVNSTEWASTRLCKRLGTDRSADDSHGEWAGEVFGLTPLTTYRVEFVRSSDDKVLLTTDVMTLSSISYEEGPFSPSPTNAVPLSLRPSSPTTTLNKSIAAAQAQVAEAKARQKRLRKDRGKFISSMKTDNEKSVQKSANSGNGDDKFRSRTIQLKQSTRQAEEITLMKNSRIEDLGQIPEEEKAPWAAKKAEWELEREALDRSTTEAHQNTRTLNKETDQSQESFSDTRRKLSPARKRQTKVIESLNGLTEKESELAKARERVDSEMKAKAADQSIQADQWLATLNKIEQNNSDLRNWVSGRQQPFSNRGVSLEQQQQQQQQHYQGTRATRQQLSQNFGSYIASTAPALPKTPDTPEGDLPGTGRVPQSEALRPLGQSSYPFPPIPFGQFPLQTGHVTTSATASQVHNRINHPSIVDDDDDDPARPAPSAQEAWKTRYENPFGTSRVPEPMTVRVSPVTKSSPIWAPPERQRPQ